MNPTMRCPGLKPQTASSVTLGPPCLSGCSSHASPPSPWAPGSGSWQVLEPLCSYSRMWGGVGHPLLIAWIALLILQKSPWFHAQQRSSCLAQLEPACLLLRMKRNLSLLNSVHFYLLESLDFVFLYVHLLLRICSLTIKDGKVCEL